MVFPWPPFPARSPLLMGGHGGALPAELQLLRRAVSTFVSAWAIATRGAAARYAGWRFAFHAFDICTLFCACASMGLRHPRSCSSRRAALSPIMLGGIVRCITVFGACIYPKMFTKQAFVADSWAAGAASFEPQMATAKRADELRQRVSMAHSSTGRQTHTSLLRAWHSHC